MFFSLILLALIASGGFALTYLIVNEESFMWRLAAGSIVGSAMFGLVAFVVASVVGGLTVAVVVASLLISMLPLLLLNRPGIKGRFEHDWAKAKGKLDGVNSTKVLRFAFYAFFFIVFWYFFGKAVYEFKDGIYTGGSQNYGDLPFHLGAIFSFTEGNNFPVQNPSWAGAKFSYPFIADFLASCMVKLSADFKAVMFAQNITWAFALLVILERFAARLTNSRLAGRIAPALLFFSGGVGFYWFFKELGASGKGFSDFLMHLPRDYTIGDQFRWGNSLLVLFITQRGLLLGMPLTILITQYLWRMFSHEPVAAADDKVNQMAAKGSLAFLKDVPLSPFLVGLLTGTLPLIHLHSLAVLFIISVFLFAMQPAKWRQWVAFGVGTAMIAVPELAWSIAGSATETTKFFGWHFGWDKKPDDNVLWFWLKNTGLVLPGIIAGLYLYWSKAAEPDDDDRPYVQETQAQTKSKKAKAKKEAREKAAEEVAEQKPPVSHAKTLLLFYIPFAFLFLLSNTVKLAPWQWDNIKVLIYWFVGSLPLIAYALAYAWRQNIVLKVVAAACLVVLTLSGAIDVFRAATDQVKSEVFMPDAVRIADLIRQKTPPNAVFLNGPTFNPAVVLAGRQSVMRYPGHLGSYGIDYGPREQDVRSIYAGSPTADALLAKYNIEYVLISPYERNDMKANEAFFKKFPIVAESGQFKVYKVKG